MKDTIGIVSFTDLSSSTRYFNEKGNKAALLMQADFLNFGPALLRRISKDCKYIKNIGDAHMVLHVGHHAAVIYACSVQQYYAGHKTVVAKGLLPKIGIGMGTVGESDEDVFGIGVNLASRLQGIAKAGEILLNEDLGRQCFQLWGPADGSKYLGAIQQVSLNGFDEPVKYYSLDWKRVCSSYPDITLPGLVHNHLEEAGVEFADIDAGILAKGGVMLWPVVPRAIVTAIHRGQVEIVRLLRLLGWDPLLLLADCGAGCDAEQTEAFAKSLKAYARTRGLIIGASEVMTDLYDPSSRRYPELQQLFRTVVRDLTVGGLVAMNQKGYSEDIKEALKSSKTLDFLKPALTIAAAAQIAITARRPCILMAGRDEGEQWDACKSLKAAKAIVGCVLNPLLNEDERHQARQGERYPIWASAVNLVERMRGTNLAWWIFRLCAYLPSFPGEVVRIGGVDVMPSDWITETDNPEKLDLRELSRHVWPLLNPVWRKQSPG